MPILATQAIRKMRGGAQSHLMLASDGNPYVVKFQNNPQHIRVLANELLATRLAQALELSVAPCEIIEVTDWLIERSSELTLDFGLTQVKCCPGLHCGSRLVGGLMPGRVFDYLPEERLIEVSNLKEFAGALVFDKWTCNSDGRQAVFHKSQRGARQLAVFIDQGYCFGAGEWHLVDAPLRGVFARNVVYHGVSGWESFEPWLSRVREFDQQSLWNIAKEIPQEWYEGNISDLERLVDRLLVRRSQVPELITQFRESSRDPFPAWNR
jgi:hypothetical protein